MLNNVWQKNELKLLGVILVGLFFIGINACKPQETLLSFKTIEQADSSGTGEAYRDIEPTVIIITHPNEIANLNGWINESGQEKLQALAYKNYFALAVFQGFKPTLEYGVKINRITKHNNEINIYTHFQERNPNLEAADLESSPYHVVQVQKTGEEGQVFTFNLIVSNTIVTSVSHFIPLTTTLFTSPILIESPSSPLNSP